VDPAEIPTLERTAIFEDVQVRLTGLNVSWMPREGPAPALDTRFVTVEVEILSYGLDTRSIDPSEFRYRTWDSRRQYDPISTTLWAPSPEGREPVLVSMDLENGETFRGWLTFRVPAGPSFRPDGFLWRPDPRVSFSYDLPIHSGSLVCGVFRVFGKVTDPLGAPVASAPIQLAFYNLDREGNAFEDGECRGEVTFSERDTTAADGRYEHSVPARFCTARCAVLTAYAPEASGLESVTVTGGTVFPSDQNAIAEAPELRIDAVLPFR
jgi:hypothetical protein